MSLQKGLLQAKNGADSNGSGQSRSAAAMALTHPVTQRVMQLKHDSPAEIRRVIDLVQDVNQGLWAGYKIKEIKTDNGDLSFAVDRDPDTKQPVRATPEEWAAQVSRFYSAKHGLNVGAPNPEYVRQMAECMTVIDKNGKHVVQGYDNFMFSDPDKNGHCPGSHPLDDMAYFDNFKKFAKYCEEGANLYSGSVNTTQMPKMIRDNIKEMAIVKENPELVPELRSFGAKDTRSAQIELSENPCLTVDDVANCLRNNIAVTYANKAELDAQQEVAVQAEQSQQTQQTQQVQAEIKTAAVDVPNPYAGLSSDEMQAKMGNIAFHFCKNDTAKFENALASLADKDAELYEYYRYLAGESCTSADRDMWKDVNTAAKEIYYSGLAKIPAEPAPMQAQASASAASVYVTSQPTDESRYDITD